MCYELWRYEQASAEEQAAKQKAAELIDKVKAAKPVPAQDAPVSAEQELEQETALT
jgi:hypothetical protein